jgi:uncharacterized OB-fold protein
MSNGGSTTATGPRRRHAVEGWFTEAGPDGRPALIGTRCTGSGTYFFPPERVMSRAPGHADAELEEVTLSNHGRLWSYTDARYRPPEPYVPVTDPHEPFCIAAVELDAERLVVMGQVTAGVTVDDLRVGMEMQLVLDTLCTETDDDGVETEVLVWKWAPADDAAAPHGGAR